MSAQDERILREKKKISDIENEIAERLKRKEEIEKILDGLRFEWDEYTFFIPAMGIMLIGFGVLSYYFPTATEIGSIFGKICGVGMGIFGLSGIIGCPISIKKRENAATAEKERNDKEIAAKEREKENSLELINTIKKENKMEQETQREEFRRRQLYQDVVQNYSNYCAEEKTKRRALIQDTK